MTKPSNCFVWDVIRRKEGREMIQKVKGHSSSQLTSIITDSQWQLLYICGTKKSLGITPVDSDDKQLVSTPKITSLPFFNYLLGDSLSVMLEGATVIIQSDVLCMTS